MDNNLHQPSVTNAQLENETVEDMLNRKIQYAREQVEKLCIIKAKAETVGVHKMPANFLRDIVWS